MKYRFDLVFSYWIFTWFALHLLGFVRASPKLALEIGLTANVFIFIVMAIYGNPNALFFAPINIALKAVPLYIVWNERVRWPEDAQTFGLVFAIYLFWTWAVGENVVANARLFADSWANGTTPPKSYPGTALIKDIFQ
jgi:hypothetical protein